MSRKFKYVFFNSNRLKESLIERGVMLKEVSDNLGITYRSLSNKFKGITEFKLSEILSICKTYEIDVYELIDFTIEQDMRGGNDNGINLDMQ